MFERTRDGSRARTAFEFSGVSKTFGAQRALSDVTFCVDRGETIGFVGLNGAGKSTTMRILLGLVRPSTGLVVALGSRVLGAKRRSALIGALIDRPGLYQHLSAEENLRVFASMNGMEGSSAQLRIDRVLGDLELGQYGRKPLRQLSTGMRQRVGIGTAFLGDPELVVLDEPTEGLDPEGFVAIRELIQARVAEGVTIFLSSHRMGEVETLADRVVVIGEGRILADTTPNDLRGHRHVVARFDSPNEADRAAAALRARGRSADREGLDTCLIKIGGDDGSAILRELVASGLFPAELQISAPSLEESFLALARSEGPNGG